MQKTRSIQIYLKPDIEEDRLLLDTWSLCRSRSRPQVIFRRMLHEGLRVMIDSGELPPAIAKELQDHPLLLQQIQRKGKAKDLSAGPSQAGSEGATGEGQVPGDHAPDDSNPPGLQGDAPADEGAAAGERKARQPESQGGSTAEGDLSQDGDLAQEDERDGKDPGAEDLLPHGGTADHSIPRESAALDGGGSVDSVSGNAVSRDIHEMPAAESAVKAGASVEGIPSDATGASRPRRLRPIM